MNPTQVKWTIFSLLCTTFPVLFYMAVVGGFLPLFAIAIMALSNLGDFYIGVYCLAHLIAYGAIFYFVASIISKRLAKLEQQPRQFSFALVVIGLLILGNLKIFGAAHGMIQWKSAYQIYLEWGKLK